MSRCRWIKDRAVPGGRFLAPGCINRAVYGDAADCHCGGGEETIRDYVDRLEKRLKRLEARLNAPDMEE